MFSSFPDAKTLAGMIDRLPVCPFPLMSGRAAWSSVSPEDAQELRQLYIEYSAQRYPLLTASQFMAFVSSGSRKAYEAPYFLRRRKLCAAMLHMCLTGTDEAIGDVIDGLWLICEESSWVIAAHNVNPIPGVPAAKDKPLPDASDPYIDLFAAQTAMILSLTVAMTGEALDRAAPIVKKRVLDEIERRILTPFETRDDFWWMGFIRRDLCNWTPWIVSNLLLTAMLCMDDKRRFASFVVRAFAMVDRWLDVVPQDGGCDEGTAYFNMAGGALLDCLEFLECATGGRLTFWQDEKLRSILTFPLKTRLEGGWFVNFADCDAKPFLCGERLQMAGEKICDPQLEEMGVSLRGTLTEQIADTPHLTRLLMRLFHPAIKTQAGEQTDRDVWLPDLQVRVYERGGMILCAKGGHNGESHNHNDVGSFMLYFGADPQLIDLGNMTYTAKTFSSERYTLFNTRSSFHNLPLIGLHEQQPGERFAARDVRRLDGGLCLDIAGAYAEEAGVQSLVRRLELTDEGFILMDSIKLAQPEAVSWVFMLRNRPHIETGGLSAGAMRLRYDAGLKAEALEIEVKDPRMAKSFPGSVWRLTLSAPSAAAHIQTFLITRR